MDLSMIGFGFGMASIFGLIVGIFSVWNGRMTRREITEYIRNGEERTARLIKEVHTETQNLIEKSSANTQNHIERSNTNTRNLTKETQALIKEMHRETQELIAREMGEFRRLHDKMDEKLNRIETKIQK